MNGGAEKKQRAVIYAALALLVLVVVLGGIRIFQRLGVIPELAGRGGAKIAAPRTSSDSKLATGEIKEAPLPAVPRLEPGCEEECCGQLNSKKVLKATVLLSKPEPDSAVVKEIPEGTEFKEAINYVRVLKHGRAIVREDVRADGSATTSDLAVGDELELLSYEGEGFYLVWAKGKVRVLAVDPPLYEIQSDAETEGWVEITLLDGTKGWALAPELDWGFC